MSENQIHKHLSPADSLSLYSKSCATGRAHKPAEYLYFLCITTFSR